MNRHVGVIHSCLSYKKNGECDENFLYVISRHDSIDHTELSVLETVANSVCIPVEHLVHMALHGEHCCSYMLRLRLGPIQILARFSIAYCNIFSSINLLFIIANSLPFTALFSSLLSTAFHLFI